MSYTLLEFSLKNQVSHFAIKNADLTYNMGNTLGEKVVYEKTFSLVFVFQWSCCRISRHQEIASGIPTQRAMRLLLQQSTAYQVL